MSRHAVGPAAEPLEFPQPHIFTGRRENFLCYNHSTQLIEEISNVLYRDVAFVEQAYWPRWEKAKTNMSHIEICVLLTRYFPPCSNEKDSSENSKIADADSNIVMFQTTERLVAVKVSYVKEMTMNHTSENPDKEISAMQLAGNDHPNVLGCIEALQDQDTLNVVMNYCAGGDLFDLVKQIPRGYDSLGKPVLFGMSEDTARKWFRQVISGIRHLHNHGICHRDLSPENVVIADDICLIIDMGVCLRIPYTDPNGPTPEAVTDTSQGTEPRLITPQGRCGKFPYMTPEIYRNNVPFDGSAADVWTAGTILFFMLTGEMPYGHPDAGKDQQFYWVKRDLRQLLLQLGVHLSEHGYNLLRGMLRANFRARLTLAEIEEHPWFAAQEND